MQPLHVKWKYTRQKQCNAVAIEIAPQRTTERCFEREQRATQGILALLKCPPLDHHNLQKDNKPDSKIETTLAL